MKGNFALWSFVVVALLSVLVGFVLLPTEGANETYPILLAWPLLFAVVGMFIFSIRGATTDIWTRLQFDRWLLLCISAVLLWLLSAEPFMLKIVHDEGLIASTAQSFHRERAAAVSAIANWSNGTFETYEGFIDKRPLLLPFLTSLLHDLSGYRLGNVFFLNALLTLGLLGLTGSISRKLADRRSALFGLILLAFLPVLAQGATSGNASILNAVMLVIAILLGVRYFESPSESTLPALVYSLILLANTRYESILYIIPFGILILLGWRKAERIILTPSVIIAPLFLIFNAWQLRYAMAYETFYIQDGPNGRDAAFSITYVLNNLQETLKFLFAFNDQHPNSPFLSIFGVAGMGVLGFRLASSRLSLRLRPITLLLFGLLLTNLVVILCFNFGVFTNYVTARLSLPIYLLICLFAILAFFEDKRLLFRIAILITAIAAVANVSFYGQVLDQQSAIQFVLGIIILIAVYAGMAHHAHRLDWLLPSVLLLASVALIAPKMRNHPYLERYVPAIGVQHILDFVQEHQARDTLFLVWNPIYPIALQANTIDPPRLMSSMDKFREALETGHYRKIYHFTSIDKERAEKLQLQIKLPDFLERIQIEKRRLAPGYFFEAYEIRLRADATIPEDVHEQETQGNNLPQN